MFSRPPPPLDRLANNLHIKKDALECDPHSCPNDFSRFPFNRHVTLELQNLKNEDVCYLNTELFFDQNGTKKRKQW